MNALTLVVQGPPGDEEERLVGDLPEGETGTEATVAAMIALIRSAALTPQVRGLARYLSTRDMPTEAAVFRWLRNSIKFHRDPPELEFLRHPARMIEAHLKAVDARETLKPIGDCDDVADLCCAVLLAAGLRPVLVVVAADPAGPFVHVYSGVRRGPDYYPLDPQELAAPGREVQGARRRVFDVAP